MARAEFQQAVVRLSRDVRLGHRGPREAARELLHLVRPSSHDAETVERSGDWNLEVYGGQGFTLVPERQTGPVRLTSVADEDLKTKYFAWCELRGGGDCLGLLDDGHYLHAADRHILALAFGNVLDEPRSALVRELFGFTILDPIGRSRELNSVQWPGRVGPIAIETLSEQPARTTALTEYAPTLAKRYDTTPEALRAVLEQFDCIVY